MTEQDIYERLNEIGRNIFDADDLLLTPKTTADDIEGWDSLSHINFLATIEAAFKIKFKSAEIEKLKNIGELVATVRSHLGD